jgi:hypothetical protein
MNSPMIYADFNNADEKGRLRLNCAGTAKDLFSQKIQLSEGLKLTFYSDDADERGMPDDLHVDGIVEYSSEEKGWVAVVDWKAIRHASDGAKNARAVAPAASRHVG